MTLLLKTTVEKGMYLPMLTSVSIMETIKKCVGISVELKWINDIFMGNKKVGGILIRNNIIDNTFYTQIGIGINVNKAPV